MARLGDTVAGIVRSRKRAAGPAAHEGLMTEVRGFGFNPGALRMLVHVPQDLPAGAPLVVVLHGCTQRAADYAAAAGWLALADRLGFAVLAPEQSTANNANRCFNWFEPQDVTRGGGEVASIQAMVAHMLRQHGLDAERVFVSGLSAGGAMTAALLATYPETFAAGAVVAGLPFGVATDVQSAFGAMRGGASHSGADLAGLVARAAPPAARRPRLAIWHGEADHTVNRGAALALSRQWAALNGLNDADEVQARPGWTRSVWRAGDEAVIELNMLAGLGHGTPISALGADPLGAAGPFVLEAGISSTLEIARFWGLAPADTAEWTPSARAETAPASHPASGGLGAGIMAAVSPHVSADVQAVISEALASAGLMKRA